MMGHLDFSVSDVHALRRGAKTRHRSAIKQPEGVYDTTKRMVDEDHVLHGRRVWAKQNGSTRLPWWTLKGIHGGPKLLKAGDRLWVKEPYWIDDDSRIWYAADGEPEHRSKAWRSSYWMKPEQSRFLVQLEADQILARVFDISTELVWYEGFSSEEAPALWNDRYKARNVAWVQNPWVLYSQFKLVRSAATRPGEVFAALGSTGLLS